MYALIAYICLVFHYLHVEFDQGLNMSMLYCIY